MEVIMTGYEMLCRLFGLGIDPPFEAHFVDWDKAELLKDQVSDDTDMWELFLTQVGFRKDRILLLTRPALCSLIGRMFEMPLLPLGSDTGLTEDGRLDDFHRLTIIPKDTAFAQDFMKRMIAVFADFSDAKLHIKGGMAGCMGRFGPILPVDVCLECHFPLTFFWELQNRDPAILPGLWERVARVCDMFDGQGFSEEPLSSFAFALPPRIPEEWIDELYVY